MQRRERRLHAFAWTAVFIVWHALLGARRRLRLRRPAGRRSPTPPPASRGGCSRRGRRHVRGRARRAAALARSVGPRRLLRRADVGGRRGARRARARRARGRPAPLQAGSQETGLSGLSDQEVLGTAHPSAHTMWSTVGIDVFFAAGAAVRPSRSPRSGLAPVRSTRSFARGEHHRRVGHAVRGRSPLLGSGWHDRNERRAGRHPGSPGLHRLHRRAGHRRGGRRPRRSARLGHAAESPLADRPGACRRRRPARGRGRRRRPLVGAGQPRRRRCSRRRHHGVLPARRDPLSTLGWRRVTAEPPRLAARGAHREAQA